MRKCWLPALAVVFCLAGCEYLYKKPEGGGSSVAENIQKVAESFGPWGAAVSGVIGLFGIGYGAERHSKHKKVVKENKQLRAKLPAEATQPGEIPPTPPA